MCGITGFIAFPEKSQRINVLKKMTDIIKHRGPDDEGYYAVTTDNQDVILIGDDTPKDSVLRQDSTISDINYFLDLDVKFALGHRRLSIVDLSDLGHQPLSIDNGRYWICFNGEVYNHIEIKEELIKLSYSFISKSDTEVILTAYKEWGSECLHKFNGMFAFIIYDKIKNEMFIARDRFGVKPLYYYSDHNGIYFASEIKQFTVIPGWTAKLNHQRAYDFLMHGLTDHTDETMFANVYQIRGGEYLEINLNCMVDSRLRGNDRGCGNASRCGNDKEYNVISDSIREPFEINMINGNNKLPVKKWYDLKNEIFTESYLDACSLFKEKFTDSVKLRMRSDVDIGSCLSGGLDSSAIVSVMHHELQKQNANNSIKTFSACSHHKEFDEKEYVDIVVNETNAKAFYTYPELNELFDQNEQITWHQDEPFGSTSIYAQWEVFKLAKSQNIKVMLDGQGADEQLCGYKGLYIQTYFNELFRKFKFITLYKEINLFHNIHNINKKYAWLQVFFHRSQKLKERIKTLLNLFPDKIQYKIIGKKINSVNFNSWINKDILNYKKINPFLGGGINLSDIKKTSFSQLNYTNLSMLLHFEDRDSMAHSIESRVPFLDYNVVELVYSLPTNYKISNGTTKRVLRDGLNGILPNKIKNRQTKLGFVTPEEIWVKENVDLFRIKMIEAIQYSQGVLNKEYVLARFEKIINGNSPFDSWVWRVISFGAWIKVFKVDIE